MNELFNNYSPFWQGVFATIITTILLTGLGFFVKLLFKQLSQSSFDRKTKFKQLKMQIVSENPIDRSEASYLFIFDILKYLFLGNILWVAPESIYNIIPFKPIFLLKLLSLVFFIFGIRSILIFTSEISKSKIKFEIIRATYGTIDKEIDVTEHLKHKVVNGKLGVRVWSSISGEDPAPNVQKVLTVSYKLNGKEYEKRFLDGQTTNLP